VACALCTTALLTALGVVINAVPVPAGTVYVANEVSNTVSVIANHVWFVGKLAYMTIGGPPPCAAAGKADRPGKMVILDRTTHTIAREITGLAFTGDSPGIWGDGRRLYIGHESGHRLLACPLDPPTGLQVGLRGRGAVPEMVRQRSRATGRFVVQHAATTSVSTFSSPAAHSVHAVIASCDPVRKPPCGCSPPRLAPSTGGP
jgi:hypothetical protein